MIQKVRTAILQGTGFLVGQQLASGEFPTLRAQKEPMGEGTYIGSVFVTSFVLHSLSFLRPSPQVEGMGDKAVEFLLSERDASGFWRFLGRNPLLAPDLDSTCCVLASLWEWRTPLNYQELAERILDYRLDEGAFWTWVLDNKQGSLPASNDIDWVVNANVVFYFSLMGQTLPQTQMYLEEVVRRNLFQGPSMHYCSPLAFVYCVSRAIADGSAHGLAKLMPAVTDYLAKSQGPEGGFGAPLEDALGTVALLNCGVPTNEVEKAISRLLGKQLQNGGWEAAPFFREPAGHLYGSPALTTALAVEALAKYLGQLERAGGV